MPALRSSTRVLILALVILLPGRLQAGASESAGYDKAEVHFQRAATAELAKGILPGFSVAWIVDGQLVYGAGFGQADWQHDVPATIDTIYRAGSISKLFNAVAAMQLVERGQLDLDAPIQAALPEFSIRIPFPQPSAITVRQLLCHRSGMIREAPVGGYLDPGQPSVEATVRSVAGCALVNPPNSKTRYSNVGPTIVGRALEVRTGRSFAEYQRRNVLKPLGMSSSAWTMTESLRPRLAKGRMRIARGDGGYDFEPAPEFELGTIPAGNLYTTARDLARFAAFLMSPRDTGKLSPPLLRPASLDEMCRPQFIEETTGFGLGFYVGEYRGHKTVQHGGAVYGFSTRWVVLPKQGIGVVVLANCDVASGRVRPLADLSLDLLLETARGQTMPEPPKTIGLSHEELRPMAGEYESASYWARFDVKGNSLVGEFSGQPIELAATGPLEFLGEGPIMHREPFVFERDDAGSVVSFTAAGQPFGRVAEEGADEVPEAWQAFVGKYGPRFIPLVISIRHGHLYATVENEYDYRLTPLNRVTFELPPGMYADEEIVFQADAAGTVCGAIMANMLLPRHAQ